jgi:hypothetical protein
MVDFNGSSIATDGCEILQQLVDGKHPIVIPPMYNILVG